jgi:hypothetical protein
MGWSWVRVSTGTSPKLRECIADDPSATRFEECVRSIVEAGGGDADEVMVKFDLDGRRARVGFAWEHERVKNAVVYDLGGRQVHDFLDADEIEGFRTGDPPTTT